VRHHAARAAALHITGQFTERYKQAGDLQAQLDDIQAAQPFCSRIRS
jgi:hypothetical protein